MIQLRLRKAWYSIAHPALWGALRLGVAPSLEHSAILGSIDFDLLLDVGANRGQFSLMVRSLRPKVPIHAYEPHTGEAAIYRRLLGRGRGVLLHEFALGEAASIAELHVSRRADSSSLLPIGELQSELFPNTDEIGTRSVDVLTLDSLPEHWSSACRALLKLDVQGFELSVLRGAKTALKHCAYVFAECSEIQLYKGQALLPEVSSFLSGEGFSLVKRTNEQWINGRLVQADYLFARRE
jgi:FkbM family methyltransferase